MKKYSSRSNKESGVTGYELYPKAIHVRFTNNQTYVYSYHSAGKEVVEEMKKLAKNQRGLSTFISQNNPGYEALY